MIVVIIIIMVKDLLTEVEAIAEVPRGHLVLFSLQYRSNVRQVGPTLYTMI